jgi:anti-sigma-K factor RskA
VPPAFSRAIVYWSLLAAALAVLVVTNVLWAQHSGGLRQEVSTLQQRQDELAALLTANTYQQINLEFGSGEIPEAAVWWNFDSNQGALSATNLPPLDSDHTYQFWLIHVDGPMSAGVFEPDNAGRELLFFEAPRPIAEFIAVGISVEPAGGSEAPSTEPIAIGEILSADT